MQRRRFLRWLGLGAGLGSPWAARTAPKPTRRRILLQESPLAGFQYHAGPRLWLELVIGEPLELVREPDNPYDTRAVAVYWGDERIGYLPRLENAVAAGLMDRGERLSARIERLRTSRDPWERVRLSVWLEV